MIFSAHESHFENFKLVREIRVNHLCCPLSNQCETMVLSLYSYEENRGFIDRTSPKLAGVFAREKDNKPIATVDWTPEMEGFFKRERQNTDKFDRTWRFTMGAKIWFAMVILLMGGMGYATYHKVQKGEKINWYIFTGLWDSYDATPQLGTKYFVITKNDGIVWKRFWVKIEEVLGDNRYAVSVNTHHNPISNSSKKFDIQTFLQDKDFEGKILVEFQPHFSSNNSETQAAFVDEQNHRVFFLQKPSKKLSLDQVKLPLSAQEAYR
ncbi:hypothetical protein [Rodentibacter trehalosifermentans]|uniref:hypothetical protein n=1 Tax=Rodentibacter trehalosifermentans TaxID=1908263 RepID=UPI000987A876|nr:hypothetical protein [Rodentibacter trehalosifermentans]OOF49452.1 hypothetical protein BKK53_08560 [Rodentibacter trehalosifermentans]